MSTEEEKNRNSNFIKLSYDIKLSEEEKKEKLLSLFSEDTKRLICNKHLSSHTLITGGKTVHVIYIADDEQIKNTYNSNSFK